MKKVNYRMEIIEECPELPLFCEKQRQTAINSLAERALEKGAAEEEAIGLFLWRSKGPADQNELMLFHAFYLMHQSSRSLKIESKEEAFEILGAPYEFTVLAEEELFKEIKLLYWKQFNDLSCDLKRFLKNAREIGRKKSAFDYLTALL
ncbi:hypothetical protein ACOBQJ_08210 [Pelotomaculum propionicicum]|uniref:hypothetical protein n=1 Tax=Pelotomaculum propionicicum TaxID=258475 RepID=UPI003B7C5B3E